MKKLLQTLGLLHTPSEAREKLFRDRDSIYFKPEIRKVYPDKLLDFNDNFKHIHKETQRNFVEGLTRNILVAFALLLATSCATIQFDRGRVEAVEGYKETCLYLLSYKDDKGRSKMVYMEDACNSHYVNDSIIFNEPVTLR